MHDQTKSLSSKILYAFKNTKQPKRRTYSIVKTKPEQIAQEVLKVNQCMGHRSTGLAACRCCDLAWPDAEQWFQHVLLTFLASLLTSSSIHCVFIYTASETCSGHHNMHQSPVNMLCVGSTIENVIFNRLAQTVFYHGGHECMCAPLGAVS